MNCILNDGIQNISQLLIRNDRFGKVLLKLFFDDPYFLLFKIALIPFQNFFNHHVHSVHLSQGGIDVETFMLTSQVPVTHFPMKEYELASAAPAREALKGEREVYWEELGGFRKTSIYSLDGLRAGNTIDGPAIIEADNTTYVIVPGWKYTMDRYLNGIIELKK
mgnify:CR=1 FL=1